MCKFAKKSEGLEKVDFLIIGQGIAGSLLAHELLERGCSVLVTDPEHTATSSMKAAGIYNPITGRKMVKTWLADLLFQGLEAYYRSLEQHYHCHVLHPRPIYRPFVSVAEQNDWQGRAASPDYQPYIDELMVSSLGIPVIYDPHGGLKIKPSGHVDLPTLLEAIKKSLKSMGIFRSESYNYQELETQDDRVVYRDIIAKKIICCEGPAATTNPYWKYLPFRLVKGEIMNIEADLPKDIILNRGVFVLPVHGIFRVGSTYDHKTLDFIPSPQGIKKLEEGLSKTFHGKYRILEAFAGVRPATYDRKPFIGLHPENPQVGIFNGFGTKGVSLVPFFAKQFVTYLLQENKLMPEVDINRVNE